MEHLNCKKHIQFYYIGKSSQKSFLFKFQQINTKTVRYRETAFNPVVIFTCESSYCFQRVLAITILSVCPSVCPSVTQMDQSKTVQDRITKPSPSAAWKTLV